MARKMPSTCNTPLGLEPPIRSQPPEGHRCPHSRVGSRGTRGLRRRLPWVRGPAGPRRKRSSAVTCILSSVHQAAALHRPSTSPGARAPPLGSANPVTSAHSPYAAEPGSIPAVAAQPRDGHPASRPSWTHPRDAQGARPLQPLPELPGSAAGQAQPCPQGLEAAPTQENGRVPPA